MTSFVSVDLPDAEDPKNVVRVGWSADSTSLQLGNDLKFYQFIASRQ